jgi:hypothetical protein
MGFRNDDCERFKLFGLDEKIIPLRVEAWQPQATTDLMGDWGTITEADVSNGPPFADGYFDAIVGIDAYRYFGGDACCLDDDMAPLLKKEGLIAASIFGLKEQFCGNVPEERFKGPRQVKNMVFTVNQKNYFFDS